MLEGGGIKMSFRENVERIPVIKHKFSYVLMIILFLLLLKTPFLYWTGIKEQGIMFSHCAFLLFSVTIGLREFHPYYNKSTGIWRVMTMAMTIFLCSFIAENLVGALLQANDPQQLEQYTFHVSWRYTLNHFGRYSLVGIGEEIFKWMFFLILYAFTFKACKRSMIAFMISTVTTSLIFGYLHINYNLDQALNITLIIAASAVVYFYFLIKYQTIIPLMIAHGLQDFLVSLELTSELEGIYILSVYTMFILVVGVPMVGSFYRGIKTLILHFRYKE